MSVLATVAMSAGWAVTAVGWWRARRRTLTDALTGLANREALTRVHRHTRGSCGLLMLDLDQFKPINDTHGHDTGDALLKVIANRLRGVARPGEMAVRLHGDEFVLWLGRVPQGEAGRDYAKARAAEVRDVIAQPAIVDGHVLCVSASVGVSTEDHRVPLSDLLTAGDEGMYAAKFANNMRVSLGGISQDRRHNGRIHNAMDTVPSVINNSGTNTLRANSR